MKRHTLATRAGGAVLALTVGTALAFLAIPLVALFTEVPLAQVPTLLRDPAVRDAIVVTARTNAVANVLVIVFGTPTAWVLATRHFPGRSLVLTLTELPLVLPPAVAGMSRAIEKCRWIAIEKCRPVEPVQAVVWSTAGWLRVSRRPLSL